LFITIPGALIPAILVGSSGDASATALDPIAAWHWPGVLASDGVLRYLPTHMSAPKIAAELYLSANTVKTHLRHLYRKLGAHSRHEAVKRAQAIGLLAVTSSRP